MDDEISFSEYDDFFLCVVITNRGSCSFAVPREIAELVLTDASDAAIEGRLWQWTRDNRPEMYRWARSKQLRHTDPPPAPPDLRLVH